MGNTKSTTSTYQTTSTIASTMNSRPLLTLVQRQIIKYCMDNAKDDIGERIFRRTLERRDDFKRFINSFTKAQRSENSTFFKNFLHGVCDNLTDLDEINRISSNFGSNHVQFRSIGFKPEFFSWIADSVTLECAFLDRAAHPAGVTAESWAIITGYVFTAVRDGYYTELRKYRRSLTRAQRSLDEPTITKPAMGKPKQRSRSLDLLDISSNHTAPETTVASENLSVIKTRSCTIVRSRPVKKNDLSSRMRYSR